MTEVKKENPFSKVGPWDLVASGYAETTRYILEEFSKEALGLTTPSEEMKILDVACGPGTLSLLASPLVNQIQAVDFSQSMLDMFAKNIETENVTNIQTQQADGQNLPFENESFERAYSMFGLMFFPDRQKGFNELYRTLRHGGMTAVGSWVPVDESPAMDLMFGAIRAINPEIPEPKRVVDSLQDPNTFKAEMEAAGFKNVEIKRITKSLELKTHQEFWDTMVKGSAPIVVMKENMGEELWKEKEVVAMDFIKQKIPEVPASMPSSAWIGIGTK